jgi:hypothetical protein
MFKKPPSFVAISIKRSIMLMPQSLQLVLILRGESFIEVYSLDTVLDATIAGVDVVRLYANTSPLLPHQHNIYPLFSAFSPQGGEQVTIGTCRQYEGARPRQQS